MVNEPQMEAALAYLAESDLEFAHAKTALMRAEFMEECAEDMVFLSLTEGTVEEKKRRANVSDEHKKSQEDVFTASTHFEKLKARRARAMIVIEVWRSINSSRKAGMNL